MQRMIPILLISLLFPAVVHAARDTVMCPLVDARLIQVDGLLTDWPPGPELTKAAADRRDAGLALRCAYDDARLYVSINVSDDRVIRGKGPEDRLVVGLGGGKLEVRPGSDSGADLAWRWLDKVKGVSVEVADSLQKSGWSVEIALPLAKIPGFQKGTPSVAASLELSDVDQAAAARVEDTLAIGDAALSFEGAARTLKAFLDEAHARPADITLDTTADVDGEPGLERVVVARTTLGILSDGYMFLELPAASPADLKSVKVVDFGGGGKSSIVVHYTEHGAIGEREVVAVFALRAGAIARVFAHEVAKQMGANRLTNRFELVPRPRGKRGVDLVIQVGDVRGFSAETWNETPAADMAPILLPWGEKKQETWHFDHDEVSGG